MMAASMMNFAPNGGSASMLSIRRQSPKMNNSNKMSKTAMNNYSTISDSQPPNSTLPNIVG